MVLMRTYSAVKFPLRCVGQSHNRQAWAQGESFQSKSAALFKHVISPPYTTKFGSFTWSAMWYLTYSGYRFTCYFYQACRSNERYCLLKNVKLNYLDRRVRVRLVSSWRRTSNVEDYQQGIAHVVHTHSCSEEEAQSINGVPFGWTMKVIHSYR